MSEQKSEAAAPRARKVRRIPIDQLSPHLAHKYYFDPTPAEEVQTLAEEMRANARLPCHVEVQPDGTVLYGLKFVQAARLAGWADMEVTVRRDLDGLDEVGKELEMLTTHLRHGGLSRMTTVRCLAQVVRVADEGPPGRRPAYQAGALRKVVARHLGISERSADRYVAAARLPRRLQQAFDTGEVNIQLAERVSNLDEAQQEAVVAAMEGGVRPKDALAAHLPGKPRPYRQLSRDIETFVNLAGRALAALGTRAGEVKSIGRQHVETLRALKNVIDPLLGEASTSSPCGCGRGDPAS